jgi:hypothetical protein
VDQSAGFAVGGSGGCQFKQGDSRESRSIGYGDYHHDQESGRELRIDDRRERARSIRRLHISVLNSQIETLDEYSRRDFEQRSRLESSISKHVTGPLGARMNEREGITQVREGQEEPRAKGGKKAAIKRSKGETPLQQQESEARRSAPDQPVSEGSERKDAQDPKVIAKIEQRAYLLFEAGGFEHGHDLEHWLEAERQISAASNRPER